jgi:hypothetical protein
MLEVDLPYLSLQETPQGAVRAMRARGRSALVTGGPNDFRVIAAADVFRAAYESRPTLGNLPYHPVESPAHTFAPGPRPRGAGDFKLIVVLGDVARILTRSELIGWPLMAGPVDCYCTGCGEPAPMTTIPVRNAGGPLPASGTE